MDYMLVFWMAVMQLFLTWPVSFCIMGIVIGASNRNGSGKGMAWVGIIYLLIVWGLYIFEIVIIVKGAMQYNDAALAFGASIVVIITAIPVMIASGGIINAVNKIFDKASQYNTNTIGVGLQPHGAMQTPLNAPMNNYQAQQNINMRQPQPHIQNTNQYTPTTQQPYLTKAEVIVSSNHQGVNCGICRMPTIMGTVCIQLSCGHLFDQTCFNGWITQSSKCPLCNGQLLVGNTPSMGNNLQYPVC